MQKEIIWTRQRGTVLEIQYYNQEKNTVRYEYYIQHNEKWIPLPNLTDFNRNDEGKVMELYKQR